MMKLFKNEDAFTGLEAAIVLIAFVVVAAVFSYVMLNAGSSQPRRRRGPCTPGRSRPVPAWKSSVMSMGGPIIQL